VIQKTRFVACTAALLLAGSTAWAQPVPAPSAGSYAQTPLYTTEFVAPCPNPLPPPCPATPACPAPTMCQPACHSAAVPAPAGPEGLSTTDAVAELMLLYRMLYRQGKHEEAGQIARQVQKLSPFVGDAALALIGRHGCCATSSTGGCAECGARCGCCASCCTQACQAATRSTCAGDCKSAKDDGSNCCCTGACQCKGPAKPTSPCAQCIGGMAFVFRPGLPGPVPLPMMLPLPPPPCAGPVACMPCPLGPPYPMMGACGPLPGLPMPAGPCCMAPTPCAKPSKPTCHEACKCAEAATMPAKPEGCTPICITASGGRVHIATPSVEVECDRLITLDGHERAVVEGNVNVQLRVAHQPAGIIAERIAVGLRDGTYEINPDQGTAARVKCEGADPTTGCTTMPPADEASKPVDDGQEID
jgi:hypothetical protein